MCIGELGANSVIAEKFRTCLGNGGLFSASRCPPASDCACAVCGWLTNSEGSSLIRAYREVAATAGLSFHLSSQEQRYTKMPALVSCTMARVVYKIAPVRQ